MIYSGIESAQWTKEGVGCVSNKQKIKEIREWKGISERLMAFVSYK